MAFDGDEEDPSEGERSGSAERDDIDMDGLDGEGKVPALGTGSGGVKGRRKGMVFKCETCSKVSVSALMGCALLTFRRSTGTLLALSNTDGNTVRIGKRPLSFR